MKELYDILNESFNKYNSSKTVLEESANSEAIRGILDLDFEDEDTANLARLKPVEEARKVEEKLEVPQNVEMMTIEDLIAGMHENVSDETMDRQLKLFKKIANILGVKRYDDIIVAINDGEYDPKYLMQDGYPIDIGSQTVTHYPAENIVVENIDGNLYLYFVTEKSCNNYFALANKFLNDYDIDPTYVEDTAEPEHIEIPRVDDEFKWSL